MKNIIGTKYNIWISTNNEDLTNERLIYSFVNFERFFKPLRIENGISKTEPIKIQKVFKDNTALLKNPKI